MRCSNINFHAEIPVPVNSDGSSPYYCTPSFKDWNNVVYEVQAVKAACEDAEKVPIIRYDENNNPVTVGIANSVKWNQDGFIEVDGIVWFGGTSEEVVFNDAHDVISMDIESIGFGT